MNNSRRFMIVIDSCEEGGYHAWCPSLPGCHSQGENFDQARKNIIEAIQCHLESLAKDKIKLPKYFEEFVGSVEIRLPRLAHV